MQQGDSSVGQVIDGYRILEVLGKGGMGIVYKAEDIALSRGVALKMIAPELASNEAFLRRFHSEARALARVESPFIVGVHAMRQVEDRFFIVMELVDGWTLADELENGALEFNRTRVLLKQMLQAFSRAHSVGVIHRDIKPRNIMITKAGRVKVTDFGLAKLRRDDGMSTVTQGMAGTARYMSPEQIHGVKLDHRSDIYSLGMTTYEMLAGKLPFAMDEGTFSILKRIVEEEFPPPSHFNPDIPKPLVAITLKAIQKDPANRYQKAEEMYEALEAAFESSRTIAEPPENTPSAPSFSHVPSAPSQAGTSKKPYFIAAAIVAVLLVAYPAYQYFTRASDTPIENGDPAPPLGGRFAELSVSSIPAGAAVFVNNKQVGTAPSTGLQVAEGDVAVMLTLEGYLPLDTSLTVVSGTPHTLDFQMTKIDAADPLPGGDTGPGGVASQGGTPSNTNNGGREQPAPRGRLRLAAVPAGMIHVNGRAYTNSAELSLPVGSYPITFEDTRRNISKHTTLRVREGAEVSRTCYFEHKLTIVTQSENPGQAAPWASISINGKDINETTPFVGYEIYPGTYTISLSRKDYILSAAQQLKIEPTFDPEETVHRLFFTIEKEQE